MDDKNSVGTIEALPFTDIPRTTRLFNDYLYNNERVIGYYQPQGRRTLAEMARTVMSQHYQRDAVADALEQQNRRFGSPAETFKNIELLRRPDTVAIVTGQQAGLFTGPLFTIYKALSAVKVAESLRAQGISAVPVFWVASEDHDYEEVNHCRIVDTEGRLMVVRYDACWPEGARSVGDIVLCEEIETQIEQMLSTLPESEFITPLAADLRASYQVGVGFAEAFARLMARMFARYGVILMDPQAAQLKQLAAGVYASALRECGTLANALVQRSHALEAAGYHAQIYTSPDMVPLFVFDGEQRSGLVHNDRCFTLKTTGQCRTLTDLLAQLQADPGHFSPSVALRPVVQDFLLPTAAYIGGPSELAYFAQLRPVYEFFGRVQPAFVPRASFTIIQDRFAKVMNKYHLRFEDLFGGVDTVMRKVVEGSLDNGTAAVFDETEALFQSQLEKLRESLLQADPPLAEALKGSKEKIFYHLQGLRTRFINNAGKRNETVARQIERLFTLLYPDKNLQEREINVYYFLARYGYDFIDRIYRFLDIEDASHKLFYV